jgi:hypothetical protein
MCDYHYEFVAIAVMRERLENKHVKLQVFECLSAIPGHIHWKSDPGLSLPVIRRIVCPVQGNSSVNIHHAANKPNSTTELSLSM